MEAGARLVGDLEARCIQRSGRPAESRRLGGIGVNRAAIELAERVRRRTEDYLDGAGALGDDELMRFIEDEVFGLSPGWSAAERSAVIQRVFHSFRGLDILQPLLDDPEVTEIMVNSHEEIFVEKAGAIVRVPEAFEHVGKLENLIQTIVGRVNRIVNESSPIVDARLPDGSRVNVVLPPLALKGPTMTIRRFPERPMTLADLTAKGALPAEAADFLASLVRAKYNLFISGGTGSGKTTMLNALGGCIPPDERVITIEDSAELQLTGIPNLVRLETRNANAEGKGGIDMRVLIRTALRMRPNRIIIGEVRGAEAADMLQAMNTGHEGSLCTAHANSCRDMLSRLETMVLSGMNLPLAVIRQQLASALDVMIHLARRRDGRRVVVEIVELAGLVGDEYDLRPLYVWQDDGLKPTGETLRNADKLKLAGPVGGEGQEAPSDG
jgi:pilus assembly protein CpaF